MILLRTAAFSQRIILVLLVLLGVSLRLRVLLTSNTLWHDEAWVANFIVDHSWLETITLPLPTPVGFRFAEKAMITWFGSHEIVWRLIPFLMSIGTLLLLPTLLRSFPRWVMLFTVALCSISPKLCFFSAELKQYSGEAFFAVLLGLRFVRWHAAENLRWESFLFASTILMALLFSFSASFIVAAMIIVLFAESRGDYRPGRYHAVVLLALVALIVQVALLPSLFTSNEYRTLDNYWHRAFLPLSPSLFEWVYDAIRHYLQRPLTLNPIPALIPLGFGVYGLAVNHRRYARLVAVVAFLMVAASAAHLYPVRDRLLLFAVPGGFFLIAYGIDTLSRIFISSSVGRWICISFFSATILYHPTIVAAKTFLNPNRRNSQPYLNFLKKSVRQGDLIAIDRRHRQEYHYYMRGSSLDLPVEKLGGSCAEMIARQDKRREGRVWIVAFRAKEERMLKDCGLRNPLKVKSGGEYSIYRYDPPAPSSPGG